MAFYCAIFGIDLYFPSQRWCKLEDTYQKESERHTSAQHTFFRRLESTQFHFEMPIVFLPSRSPAIPLLWLDWSPRATPQPHNVQSNILEIHVGVSIAITTLIKAAHIVHPEEQYFSLTAKPHHPKPLRSPHLHPDSDPLKQDYERSHLRSPQPTPPTSTRLSSSRPSLCLRLQLNAAIARALPLLCSFQSVKYFVSIANFWRKKTKKKLFTWSHIEKQITIYTNALEMTENNAVPMLGLVWHRDFTPWIRKK